MRAARRPRLAAALRIVHVQARRVKWACSYLTPQEQRALVLLVALFLLGLAARIARSAW